MELKKANTQNELILANSHLEEYLPPTETGEFIAVLNHKMWGKSLNIWTFFTLANGQKIKLSCYRSNKNKNMYSTKDEKYNFATIGNEGLSFKIIISTTFSGKISFQSAELLS